MKCVALLLLICGLTIITAAPLDSGDKNVPFRHSNLSSLKEGLVRLREKTRENHEQEQAELGVLKAAARNLPGNKEEDLAEQTDHEIAPDFLALSPPENPLGDTILQANTQAAALSDYLYQGDIILSEEQLQNLLNRETDVERRKRQAFTYYHPLYLWGKKVYYYFDKSATETTKTVFRAAADFWQTHSCIDVIESETATNRIRVFKGFGCFSYVGVMRGSQDLSLGNGCESLGTGLHELSHAMGFHHQQSRVDRDKHISILWDNIQSNTEDQFLKETDETNYNYGIIYDYGSIMQYDAWSFTRDQNVTMKPRQKRYKMTMGSDIIAFYDIKIMNLLYKCEEYCNANVSAKCVNGGFPNPRNCSVCICPGSYGGILCDQRPDGCGETLQATKKWQFLNATINGPANTTVKLDPNRCTWWINAEEEMGIELEVFSFYTGNKIYGGCIWGGVELKTQSDQSKTGFRICSMEKDANNFYKSSRNMVPIMAYSYKLPVYFSIRYRAIEKLVSKVSPKDDEKIRRHMDTSTTTKKSERRTATTNGPKQKPMADCYDHNEGCGALANYGYCKETVYNSLCPRSCNLCI